ncbi:MAG: YbaY family lipoprotein, partial [Pseudomonadota bacterium]
MSRTAPTTPRTPGSGWTADLLRAAVLIAALTFLGITPARAELTAVAGTILIPPALDVPQGAAMVVRIVNTRRGDGEAITLAEQRLAIAGPRTRYRLTYDRALVNAVGTYRVQVVILYAGDTLYLGNDRLPDPGSDRARELRITLREPPLRRGNSLRRLVERSWRGAVIFDEPLPNLVEAQLEFL